LRFAITGGRGFLGRNVAAHLRALGHEVTLLGRTPQAADAPGYRVVRYADPADLGAALAGVDVVLHLAGIAHARVETDAERVYREAVVDVTRSVWLAAVAAGARMFVFASTLKVYGERATDRPLNEDSPCRPESPYGAAKLEAEQWLSAAAAAGQTHLVRLRFPPIYGAGMRGAIRHLFRAARWHLPLPLHGYPCDRNFLYVGNAARLIEAIACGRMTRSLYLPHDLERYQVGGFYAAVYRAVHGRDMPPPLRIPMVRLLAARLAESESMRALVASMPLESLACDEYVRLPFLSGADALAETARALDQELLTQPMPG
jgi:UDP-glucose 4-epimerase